MYEIIARLKGEYISKTSNNEKEAIEIFNLYKNQIQKIAKGKVSLIQKAKNSNDYDRIIEGYEVGI